MNTASNKPQDRDGADRWQAGRSKAVVFWNCLRGIAFLARLFPAAVISMSVFAVLGGFTPAMNALIGKRIVDDIVHRLREPDGTKNLETLGLWLAAGVGLALVGALIRWRQAVSQDWLQRAGAVEIDRRLVNRTREIDVLVRESPEFADRQMLVQMGTGALSSNLLTSSVSIGRTLVTMLSFTGILIAFSPGLALLGLAVGVAFGIVDIRYAKKRYALNCALVKLRRKLIAIRSLLVSPYIVHEIQRANTWPTLNARMLDHGYEARDREHALERKTHRRRAMVGIGEAVISYSVYSALLWWLLKGFITLGDVNLYRSAFSVLSEGVRVIGQSASSLLAYDLQLQHLFDFLDQGDRKPRIESGGLSFPRKIEEGIEVRNLVFRYPNMAAPAIRDFSAKFRPGGVTGLLGPNGSGKTTLLKILAGVYAVENGGVLLEGRPLSEYSGEDYVAHVYMWGLTSVIHPLTLRENVAISRLSDSGNGEIEAAIRDAGADAIVKCLPNGLDTILTRVLDDGYQLSYGEGMRVILARALFSACPIMLVDEPGPGLDAQARGELLKALKELSKDRIVVVASHEPEVLSIVDRIVEIRGK